MSADVSIVTVTFGDKDAAVRVGTGLDAVQRTGGEPPAEVVVVAVGPAGRVAAEQLVDNTEGTSLRPEVVDVDEGDGYVRAANAGAAKTSGDIVVVARPEVTFHQRFLKRLRMEAGETWDFLAPTVRQGEDGKHLTGASKRGKTHRLVELDKPPRESTRISAGNGACVILRRAVLDRRVAAVGGLFEEAYETGGDLDLFWWAERAGLVVRYVPTLYVGYAVGQEVFESAPERRRQMANYRLTVWKHAEPKDVTGWLLGEAKFASEEVAAGGLSGLVRYAGSWTDSVRTAQTIRRRRGRLRR
jgi:GT2 family glycosyltransferase